MLEDILIWILAAYGCASLLATVMNRYGIREMTVPGEPLAYYQVLLFNSEQALEIEMRRLLYQSLARGCPIRISFIDHGSTDDTMKITSVFARNNEFLVGEAPRDARPITIDLRRETV